MQRSLVRELTRLDIETPAFVYDERILAEDVAAARAAIAPTGARLLLAMKAFSFEPGLRVMVPLLDGLHASSLFEARLARRVSDEGILHVTTPSLRVQEAPEIVELSDRLSFNSLGQWQRLRHLAVGRTSPGIRVNPQLSFVADERYDPSARHSKLGVPLDDLSRLVVQDPHALEGIEGILVHANCESTDFRDLLQVVERLVGRLDPLLRRLRWVNLGGGYLFHQARVVSPLHEAVRTLQDRYGVEVLFEPGTGLVMRAGSLVATVVDLLSSGGRQIAVLDASVSHVPEVLEYQFVPDIDDQSGCHRYVVAGASCLAGDQFGEHCLHRLEVGSRVVITNVGAYSLVKASWFNGIALPTVYSRDASGELTLRRQFDFDDFSTFSGGTHARQ